ncbi:MAG TPA: nuclear transport factor 2 family protein [Hyphomicrobiaceae bacterium]|nr:nuclear transport factor 2 family protein [Hyphomicrobiaceae bacterium]
MDMAALEARIRRLEDIEALRSLRNRYHACINDGRYGEIADLFTPDALVVLGYLARYEGRDAIDKGFRGMGERERFFIKQFIHSHEVQVDGDRATGVSYLEARYGRYGVSWLVSGRYDDIYVRQGGRWLFKSMIAELYYTVPAGVGWMSDEKHYLKPKS